MKPSNVFSVALMCFTGLSLLGCQTKSMIQPIPMPTVDHTSIINDQEKDTDGDGVPDSIDQCPGTPLNIIIDEKGCPPSLLPDENSIKMEVRVYYDRNSGEIKSEYYEDLDQAGKNLQKYADSIMLIEGHISEREDNTANQTLSKNRVEGIKNYLILNHQIKPNRIKTYYYGSERPIVPNDNVEDSWLNQRIYAVITNSEYDIERFHSIEDGDK